MSTKTEIVVFKDDPRAHLMKELGYTLCGLQYSRKSERGEFVQFMDVCPQCEEKIGP